MHIDDVAVLYTIRDKLGIGVISFKGNTGSFQVHSFLVIVQSLLPIFLETNILYWITHIQLDYRDWRKAIMLKKKKLGQVHKMVDL